jgi:2-C-methyl-D-erythritol 2,4-cyclodiphosphate synthase
MAPHLEKMRLNLAADMGSDLSQINIKATTTEKLGFTGREEGIACHAVVLLSAVV